MGDYMREIRSWETVCGLGGMGQKGDKYRPVVGSGKPVCRSDMTGHCMYPGCASTATKTWAQVPVCEAHHEQIRIEALRYYKTNGKMRRRLYEQIKHLTPWG